MSLSNEIKLCRVQAAGGILLIAALLFAFLNLTIPALIVLAAAGLIDLWLIYYKGDITISRWIRQLTGHRADNVIMLGLVALCWLLKGEGVAMWFLLGLLNNHLFERDE